MTSIMQQELKGASTEEEVKAIYAKHFKIKYSTSYRFDLYTPQIIFEFKYNKNLSNLHARAVNIAQVMYYIRRIKYGEVNKPLPPYVCIADVNEAFIMKTALWKNIYSSDKYDWDIAPSTPDSNMIDDIANSKNNKSIVVYNLPVNAEYAAFAKEIENCLSGQLILGFTDKKVINEFNFIDVYDYWMDIFGKDVINGTKPSKYFLCDIQKGKTHYIKEENKLIFHFAGKTKSKKIDHNKYERFWSLYEKVENQDIIREIYTKLDCLTNEKERRFTGEFFTPPKYAGKALKYIEAVAGKKWWNDPNCRLWDMAAGTGNLEWLLPVKFHKHIYLSTLLPDDVDYCKKLFPDAISFQYDYLNDGTEHLLNNLFTNNNIANKMPKILIDDLHNDKIKWIILINPPFGTAQSGTIQSVKFKKDISKTKIQAIMHRDNLGEVSRELFSQFVYRIACDFGKTNAKLCIFSAIKYLNSTNDQNFRDRILHFKYEKGFVFSSKNFSGTSKASPFPIGLLIWDLKRNVKMENQKIILDVCDDDGYKIGTKTISYQHKDNFLSKWIQRPKNSSDNIMPPLGGAITVKTSNIDTRHRVCKNFIGSLLCSGNDYQHQNLTALFSAPQASAGAHSITPEIFEQAMVVHAVRRIPLATWISHRDQYMQPKKHLSDSFIADSVVWSLFSRSNETSSLRNIQYKGKTFNIVNHFFPFKVADLRKWNITDNDIMKWLKLDNDDRYVATWLAGKKLSNESKKIINIAKMIYRLYFENYNKLATAQYKIEWWDVGWWQIRHALQDQNMGKELFVELKEKHDILKEKLLPEIIDYGFISG